VVARSSWITLGAGGERLAQVTLDAPEGEYQVRQATNVCSNICRARLGYSRDTLILPGHARPEPASQSRSSRWKNGSPSKSATANTRSWSAAGGRRIEGATREPQVADR
jgi:hypothetical protein